MSDNRRRYLAMKRALKQLYPTEPQGNQARHLHTLAAMASGIVGSRSTRLPDIASKVPDGTKRKAESRSSTAGSRMSASVPRSTSCPMSMPC
jgi:hypothetical protein